MNARKLLSQNQISIVLVGLIAGLVAPGVFRVFHPWNTLLLQAIFFLSALRIRPQEIAGYARDWKMHLLTSGFMLVALPVAVYLPLSVFAPDWALPFLIAMAAPTGMTIALVADFFGGKTSLALIVVLTTSLLAPFTIPLLTHLLLGQIVALNPLDMVAQLAQAIILPFAVAALFQRFAPKVVERGGGVWRALSVAAFGLLIASVVSKTVGDELGAGISIDIAWRTLGILIGTALWIAALIWMSYRMVWWRTVAERITIALCMVYMNLTLVLYIADTFFAAQHIVPKIIVIELILNAMLPFFKFAAGRVVARSPSSA